jgi:hypothetical protein
MLNFVPGTNFSCCVLQTSKSLENSMVSGNNSSPMFSGSIKGRFFASRDQFYS